MCRKINITNPEEYTLGYLVKDKGTAIDRPLNEDDTPLIIQQQLIAKGIKFGNEQVDQIDRSDRDSDRNGC